MGKWNDTERTWGPLTVARNEGLKFLGLYLEATPWEVYDPATDRAEEVDSCALWLHLYWWTLSLALPRLFTSHKGGYDASPVVYGFTLCAEYCSVMYGAQTHSSGTSKERLFLLPFLAWRHRDTEYRDICGRFLWMDVELVRRHYLKTPLRTMPRSRIIATVRRGGGTRRLHMLVHTIKATYKLGRPPFSWLSLLWPDRVIHGIDVEYSEEVGPGRWTWKGGTLSVYSPFGEGEGVVEKLIELLEAEGEEVISLVTAGRMDLETFDALRFPKRAPQELPQAA